jgi:hypothetical protein
LSLVVINLLVFIVLTCGKELELPAFPIFLLLFIKAVIMLSKKAKRKEEKESFKEE